MWGPRHPHQEPLGGAVWGMLSSSPGRASRPARQGNVQERLWNLPRAPLSFLCYPGCRTAPFHSLMWLEPSVTKEMLFP